MSEETSLKIADLQSQIESLRKGTSSGGSRSGSPKLAINFDLSKVTSLLNATENNHLVINETIEGKEYTLFEIQRKLGPMAEDNNVNVLC